MRDSDFAEPTVFLLNCAVASLSAWASQPLTVQTTLERFRCTGVIGMRPDPLTA
jgi:hypothetical protein